MTPQSSALAFRQPANAFAYAVGLLGLYVLSGWTLGIESMVRILPSSVAMGLGTSLLFIAAAVCLKASTAHRQWDRLALLCGWLLVVLPSAFLFETWSGTSLGIDWTSLHSTVKDGNPYPGRTAPNTCFGFLFAGLSFLILQRRAWSKFPSQVVGILVLCTLLIGALGLVGYALDLERLYQWATYNRMSAPAAVGLCVLGGGLWMKWRARARSTLPKPSPEHQITRVAAVLLTAVAVIAGLMGFWVLETSLEQSASSALLRAAKNTASNFSDTVEQRMVWLDTISTRPEIQNYVDALGRSPNDAIPPQLVSEVDKGLLREDVIGLRVFNPDGKELTTTASLLGTRAAMTLPLTVAHHSMSLLWQNGFVLQALEPVVKDGRAVGSIVIDLRLDALTARFRASQNEGETTDALVCGRDRQEAICFPSRFYRSGIHIPMFKNGKPYLAASRALLGQSGVLTVKDLRGKPVIAAYVPIGTLGLGVVLKSDTLDIFSNIRNRLNMLVVLLIGLVIAATALLRRQVHPLAVKLLASEKNAISSELRIRTVVESVGDGIVTLDDAGTIKGFNRTASEIFGYSEKEIMGTNITALMPENMREAHTRGIKSYLAGGPARVVGKPQIKLPGLRKSGDVFPLELAVNELFIDDNREFVGIIRDITERESAERNLFAEKERLRVTLASIGDAVIATDVEGQITYLNAVAEQMTGWANAEAIGQALQSVFNIVHEKTGEPALNPVELVLRDQVTAGLAHDTLLVQRNGERLAIEDSAAPIRDIDGKMVGVVLVFHDVTQARLLANKMSFQAAHDALTGLINRREFESRLAASIESGKSQGRAHTMLYLDLDQFKIVNDTCGHEAGDELLRQLTTVMLDKLRRGDTLARLGGDEFGVLLENCGTEPGLRIADMLRQLVGDFRFIWLDKVFPVGVSIGLVTFSNGGISVSDVLRRADAACYVAKDRGRNRTHVYAVEDTDVALRSGEMGWIGRIQAALDQDRFVLYSQKMLSLTGDPDEVHYEVLLRMRAEDGEIIPPMAFIPSAERYGLMAAIDRWVVHAAFADCARRESSGAKAGTCAINLSGTSVCDESFNAYVHAQIAHFGIDPSQICFEVTETAAITNLSRAAVLIRELKAIGCRFALDDFGSGMSSFAYLKHLPVDYLKIDGGFVKDIIDNPIDCAMVESINHIGHVMGIKTIAEFAENDEILARLRTLGVDFAQGYGIEMPHPLG